MGFFTKCDKIILFIIRNLGNLKYRVSRKRSCIYLFNKKEYFEDGSLVKLPRDYKIKGGYIMKLSRRIIAIFSICLTITVVLPIVFINTTIIAEAHSGRTDGNGGHKDNENESGLGYYHYHCGGYPAHLHEDGICPYAGTNNSSSLSVTNTSSANISNTISNYTQYVSTTNNITTPTVIISDTSYDNVAFNASYYASNNADIYNIYGDDAKSLYDHFIMFGMKEGRQSSDQFNILVYKENNQDLVNAFGDDLVKYYNHFIEFGANENRIAK